MRDTLQLWEKALAWHKNSFGTAMRHVRCGWDIAKRRSFLRIVYSMSRPPPDQGSGVGSF